MSDVVIVNNVVCLIQKRLFLFMFLLMLPLVAVSATDDSGFDAITQEVDLQLPVDEPVSQSEPIDIDLSGYFKHELAYRIMEPRSFTKMRNIFSLTGKYAMSDQIEVTASGWAYYDMVYDFFNYDTIARRSERDIKEPLNFIAQLDETEDNRVIDVRELYVDILLDDVDIRLGRQFIVWGVVTGVRVIDEINPMDFRELILLDILDYRVPLLSAKINYYGEENTYELILIPEIEFHKPGPPGSEFELLQKVPGTVFPESMVPQNMEVGLKVDRSIWETEFAFSYFYTWDDFPVIFRHTQVDPLAVEEPVFFPTYTRMHMFGMSFQRPWGNQIIKGEIVYVKDKYFGLDAVDHDGDGYIDHNGELQKDHIRWALGLDFNIWKTDISPALTEWFILDHSSDLIQDQFDHALTLFIRKELPQIRAVFEVLTISLLELNEHYIKPKFTFNMTERFSMAVGMDLISGKPSVSGVKAVGGKAVEVIGVPQRAQFMGNFSNSDRLFVNFKYGF